MTAPADGPTALPRRQPVDPTDIRPVSPEAPTQAAEIRNPIAASGDNCPSCAAVLARDQRYCLSCGHRRGDPRLPFMDAVVFMESSKRPPQAEQAAAAPPSIPDRRPFMSANASLIAGVATLVLAIGVGVLIGRSGESGANTANQAPQVIKVGGGEPATGTGSATRGNAGKGKSGSTKPNTAAKKKAAKKLETSSSGATKATEEAYKTAPGVELAEPEQKIGGKCKPSQEGCNPNGEFDGSFFE